MGWPGPVPDVKRNVTWGYSHDTGGVFQWHGQTGVDVGRTLVQIFVRDDDPLTR